MRENADQNNSKYGKFSCNEFVRYKPLTLWASEQTTQCVPRKKLDVSLSGWIVQSYSTGVGKQVFVEENEKKVNDM